jgi:glycine/D-amino acid oxidase-like deaminating enzyme
VNARNGARSRPTLEPGTPDVLIVGAGIVGAACAHACAQAHLRTVILERALVGGGATAAGMGHIVAMDDSPAQWALTCYAGELWRRLAPSLPQRVEYRETGTLWVAADSEEMAEVERKAALYKESGIPAQVLNAARLRSAEPHLRQDLPGALLVPQDAVLYPPVAAEWLLQQAEQRGATRMRGDAIAAGHGEVHLADGRIVRAPAIVLATGADSALLPAGCVVRKRKGHLLITDRYPDLVRHQIVELGYLKSAHASGGEIAQESVACNIQPRATGQLLIGSSRQFGDEEEAVRPALLARMLARAVEYLPALSGVSSLRVWTGFRGATDDHLPVIGPSAALNGDPSLYLAVGHEGLGITTALPTAQLIADALLGRPSAIDRTPYRPERFAAVQEANHA